MRRAGQPFGADDARNVSGQTFRYRGPEIGVVLTPEQQRWVIESTEAIDGSHRFEVVVTIQLPRKKSA
jgi:hypothetical protein